MAIDIDGTLKAILDGLQHSSRVFPDDTNKTVTLTAHADANTWSDWAEIVDNNALAFSSVFATKEGHITVIQEEELSDESTVCMLEIAWGAAHNLVTEQRCAGSGKFQNPDNHARIYVAPIPAGEIVYYRMKTATAVADTAKVHFRYHTH